MLKTWFQNVISYIQKCWKNTRFYNETLEQKQYKRSFTSSCESKRLISQIGLDSVLFQNASIFFCQLFSRTKILKVLNTAIIYKGLELSVWYRLDRIICV